MLLNKTVLQFSLIYAAALLLLAIFPKLGLDLDAAILSIIAFIMTGAIMTMAISQYLRNEENERYSYLEGFSICILVALAGRFLSLALIFKIEFFGLSNAETSLFSRAFLRSIPISLLLSFIIPSTFRKSKRS